jgi:hypothetical protein
MYFMSVSFISKTKSLFPFDIYFFKKIDETQFIVPICTVDISLWCIKFPQSIHDPSLLTTHQHTPPPTSVAKTLASNAIFTLQVENHHLKRIQGVGHQWATRSWTLISWKSSRGRWGHIITPLM